MGCVIHLQSITVQGALWLLWSYTFPFLRVAHADWLIILFYSSSTKYYSCIYKTHSWVTPQLLDAKCQKQFRLISLYRFRYFSHWFFFLRVWFSSEIVITFDSWYVIEQWKWSEAYGSLTSTVLTSDPWMQAARSILYYIRCHADPHSKDTAAIEDGINRRYII